MTDIPHLSSYVINAAVEPFKPLTPAEKRVADLVARGWGYKQIGARLNSKTRTVEHHVATIAAKLPNEDNLSPYEVVQIWALCVAVRHLLPGRAA